MEPKTIQYNVLLETLGFSKKQLQKLIKNNGLPQISPHKPVSLKIANEIAWHLQRKKIDFYSEKLKERTLENSGPYKKLPMSSVHNIQTNQLYNQIQKTISPEILLKERGKILGIVVEGGFLGGSSNNPFFVTINDGLNILIGDRGSGKSTLLNLLGILSDSTTQLANDLISSLLPLLESTEEYKKIERIKSILIAYGIEKFSCFYKVSANNIYCWHVNTTEKYYQLLKLHSNGQKEAFWSDVEKKKFEYPSMQVFLQGEVFRIADSDDRLELIALIDALFPNLYQQRKQVSTYIKKLKKRMKNSIESKPIEIDVHYDIFEKQYKDKIKVLNSFYNDKRKYSYKWYLYLKHLINETSKYPNELSNYKILDLVNDNYPLKYKRGDIWIYILVFPVFSELEGYLIRLQDFFENNDNHIEQSDINNLIMSLQKLLSNRIEFSLLIVQTYSSFLVGTRIENLFAYYKEVILERKNLLELQEDVCSQITKKFRDSVDIDSLILVETENEKFLIDSLNELIELLDGSYASYSYIEQRNIKGIGRSSFWHFKENSLNIEKIVLGLYDITSWNDEDEYSNKKNLLDPIIIKMRQGNIYRNFDKLSFGQRSGIILRLILSNTKKDIVLLDQPEDHIDTDGINTFLNSAITGLIDHKQVIVASHSSHFVMGFPSAMLYCLESIGENGRIMSISEVQSRRSVLQVLDILEGGEDAFRKRMEMYANLISKLKGKTDDINLAIIESSYRKRTLDDLRNDLQPILSDSDALNGLYQHELNKGNNLDLIEQLTSFRENMIKGAYFKKDDGNFFRSLDKICSDTTLHVNRMLNAIEQLSLLNTSSDPESFNFYDFLQDLKKHFDSESKQQVIEISESLRNIDVCVDKNHISLIFQNLIDNSFRSASKVNNQNRVNNTDVLNSFIKKIDINLMEVLSDRVILEYKDNGEGLDEEGKRKLYKERYNPRKGKIHGLGGLIIQSLLLVNNGSISIGSTEHTLVCGKHGTTQFINLPLSQETS